MDIKKNSLFVCLIYFDVLENCSPRNFSFQIMTLRTYIESKFCLHCKYLLFCYSPEKLTKVNFGFNCAVWQGKKIQSVCVLLCNAHSICLQNSTF